MGRNSVAMGNTCSGDEAVPSPESWSGFTIPYQVQTSGYRVWLFGDSILDNSYWNGVEAQTTGEWLKRMLPDIEVRDRSTEELDAMSLLKCLQQGKRLAYPMRTIPLHQGRSTPTPSLELRIL